MKFYSTKARIPVKIYDVTFYISPLTTAQKAELAQLDQEGNMIQSYFDKAKLAFRMCLKDIDGAQDETGAAFKLSFDEEDRLTEDCCETLLNGECSQELLIACMNFFNGVPKEFVNPATGKPLEGVSIVQGKSSKK